MALIGLHVSAIMKPMRLLCVALAVPSALVLVLPLASGAGAIANEDVPRSAVSSAPLPLALSVCAACHGSNGVSVADHIPNLAGQNAVYLSAQLDALKDGSRKSEIMNPIAAQLNSDQIAEVSAYFSALPGRAHPSTAKSPLLPHLLQTRVAFPPGFPSGFTRYHVANFNDDKQVKHYYANASALDAAGRGAALGAGAMIVVEIHDAALDAKQTPVLDAAGYFLPQKLRSYATMAQQTGWGAAIPLTLRNADWNYAIFTPEKKMRANINQAECLACHLPERQSSFVFTMKPLAALAAANAVIAPKGRALAK
jgi:cytochrome c553